MGDYSFFIKSTTFILLLNAAIFSFPDEVEALTGGALNTSTVSGTNVSIDDPSPTQLDNNKIVNLGEPVSFDNVKIDGDGFLIIGDGDNTGQATYNISSFDKNSEGDFELYVDGGGGSRILGPDYVNVELGITQSDGSVVRQNGSAVSGDFVVENVGSEIVTIYFNDDPNDRNGVIRSLEDSYEYQHPPEDSLSKQVTDSVGLSGFSDSLQNLISLYTAPSTGNQVLGAIFTIYLLGFIVFLLKEVVPG